jgi:hypothetical protein
MKDGAFFFVFVPMHPILGFCGGFVFRLHS